MIISIDPFDEKVARSFYQLGHQGADYCLSISWSRAPRLCQGYGDIFKKRREICWVTSYKSNPSPGNYRTNRSKPMISHSHWEWFLLRERCIFGAIINTNVEKYDNGRKFSMIQILMKIRRNVDYIYNTSLLETTV